MNQPGREKCQNWKTLFRTSQNSARQHVQHYKLKSRKLDIQKRKMKKNHRVSYNLFPPTPLTSRTNTRNKSNHSNIASLHFISFLIKFRLLFNYEPHPHFIICYCQFPLLSKLSPLFKKIHYSSEPGWYFDKLCPFFLQTNVMNSGLAGRKLVACDDRIS